MSWHVLSPFWTTSPTSYYSFPLFHSLTYYYDSWPLLHFIIALPLFFHFPPALLVTPLIPLSLPYFRYPHVFPEILDMRIHYFILPHPAFTHRPIFTRMIHMHGSMIHLYPAEPSFLTLFLLTLMQHKGTHHFPFSTPSHLVT